MQIVINIVCFCLGVGATLFVSYVGHYADAKQQIKEIDEELLRISKEGK